VSEAVWLLRGVQARIFYVCICLEWKSSDTSSSPQITILKMRRTAYANVAGKYQDVLTLEQSVAELHQMFLDFALLTEQQGELLDQIEYQVKSAADYVEDANVDVYEAIEYQKKIRKKQW